MNESLPVAQTLPANDPLEGDPELRVELAKLFLEDYEQSLSRIRQLIADRQALDLRKEAHTLKGSTGVFRDQAAFDAAFLMEMIGKNAAWDRAEAAWDTLSRETDRLATVLTRLVSENAVCVAHPLA